MPLGPIQDYELWSTIENGRLGTIPEELLLKQIYAAFTSETDRLRYADVVEQGSLPPSPTDSDAAFKPSRILFGEDFGEVNRTYLGVLAFRWIWVGDYKRFTNGQPEKARLAWSSFEWLQTYLHDNIITAMDVLAMILAIVVNDVGKDPHLIDDLFELTGKALDGSNHDAILLEAAKVGMIPSLTYLDEAHRADIFLGMDLGSDLNAGQLAQAENVPVNLEGLLAMQGNERAFNMKFIEQILDVAGASGHIYADGSKTFIEPVFQAFKTVQEVSLCIIRKECTLRQGYDQVLSRRAALLADDGFRLLSVSSPEQRALLRLLTMGRAASLEEAELFDAAFDDLDETHKKPLIDGLNIDAIDDNEIAVIPYYMPAMIAETLRGTRGSGKEQEALTALMRYLARTLTLKAGDVIIAPASGIGQSKTWPIANGTKLQVHTNVSGKVVERNMSSVRDTISSPRFREDPSVLDALLPPKGREMARRASQSA